MSKNQILNDVRIFVYIVREGSLIKAVDTLGIPLPTISRRLFFLEEFIGKKLMFRDNRSITLTPYGEEFYNSCAELILYLDRELDKLKELGAELTGTIRISAPRSLFYHCVYDKIVEFKNQNPNISFDITLPSRL